MFNLFSIKLYTVYIEDRKLNCEHVLHFFSKKKANKIFEMANNTNRFTAFIEVEYIQF